MQQQRILFFFLILCCLLLPIHFQNAFNIYSIQILENEAKASRKFPIRWSKCFRFNQYSTKIVHFICFILCAINIILPKPCQSFFSPAIDLQQWMFLFPRIQLSLKHFKCCPFLLVPLVSVLDSQTIAQSAILPLCNFQLPSQLCITFRIPNSPNTMEADESHLPIHNTPSSHSSSIACIHALLDLFSLLQWQKYNC